MGARNDELLERYQRSVMGVFGLPPLVLSHGSGCHVWDVDGNRYLDLVGGIAVNALGHGHPALVAAISKQAGEAIHVSNLFTSEGQIALAERLIDARRGARGLGGLLRQLRRRGHRGRHQAEPSHRPHRHRRGRGRLPRPHHRRPRADPQARLPRALRAPHPRRHPRPVRRRSRPARRRHRRHGRASSSNPSRVRRACSAPARHTCGWPASSRTRARCPARPRRDPDRHRPHRHAGSPSSRPGSCPTPSRSPRGSAGECRSARWSPSAPRSPGCSPPGQHGIDVRRQPARRRRGLAVLETIEEQGLLAHAAERRSAPRRLA